MKFKIDTGADETVKPPETFRQLRRRPVLSKPRRQLHGPDGKPLAIQGVARLQLSYQGRQTTQDIYVLDDVCCPLLGKPAVEELQLITCIINVQRAIKPKQEFPSLFKGLGAIKGEPLIRLQGGAKPFALSPPRRVPIPFYEKTKQELQLMGKIGVIAPVDNPMMVVPKPSGDVRICLDFTELSRFVLREWHPIPSVEHTLGLLSGAKVFSNLDANSRFWQIQLAEESKEFNHS